MRSAAGVAALLLGSPIAGAATADSPPAAPIGGIEASAPAPDLAGATRILTDTHVIVLDSAGEWRRGLGRALDAARETGRRPGVLLLAAEASELAAIERLRETVTHHGLELDAWSLLPGDVRATPVPLGSPAAPAAPAAPTPPPATESGPSGTEEREPAREAAARDAEPAAAGADPPTEEAAADALRRLLPPLPTERSTVTPPGSSSSGRALLPGNRSLFDVAETPTTTAPDTAAAPASAPAVVPTRPDASSSSRSDRRRPSTSPRSDSGSDWASGIGALLLGLFMLLGLAILVALAAMLVGWLISSIGRLFRRSTPEPVALGPLGPASGFVGGADHEAVGTDPPSSTGDGVTGSVDPPSSAPSRRPGVARPFVDPRIREGDGREEPRVGAAGVDPLSVGVPPAAFTATGSQRSAPTGDATPTPTQPGSAPGDGEHPRAGQAAVDPGTREGPTVVIVNGDPGAPVTHVAAGPPSSGPPAAPAAPATPVSPLGPLGPLGPSTIVGPGAAGGVVAVPGAGDGYRIVPLANGRILVRVPEDADAGAGVDASPPDEPAPFPAHPQPSEEA